MSEVKTPVHAGPSSIPNKPNEPETKIFISVNKIVFKCGDQGKPVHLRVNLHNPTNDVISFKVRCTSAQLFRVQPPSGVIAKGTSQEVIIWFHNSCKGSEVEGKHFFAFYSYRGDLKTSKDVFTQKNLDGVYRVPVIFAEAEGKSKNP